MNITPKNLREISFNELMKEIAKIALQAIPEGGGKDPDTLTQLDTLIGRLANQYAYLRMLYVVAADLTNTAKLTDAPDYLLLVKKKDALYEMSSAVWKKWEACSRMVTIAIEQNTDDTFERPNYEARKERSQSKKPNGWSRVPDPI